MSFKRLNMLLVATLMVGLAGCAVGQRRAQIEQALQFESVDTNGDGVVDQAEWEAMKSRLRSAKRF